MNKHNETILKTSDEWSELTGSTIMDPDGWRTNDIYGEVFESCDFYTTPITEYEFNARKSMCTCVFTIKK